MAIVDILAEQRIAEALRRGDFDDLPGAGQPLVFEDELLVPSDTRAFNRVLRNAGYTPPEIGLRREIAALRRSLADTPAGEARQTLARKLAMLMLQLAEIGRAAR